MWRIRFIAQHFSTQQNVQMTPLVKCNTFYSYDTWSQIYHKMQQEPLYLKIKKMIKIQSILSKGSVLIYSLMSCSVDLDF